MRETIELRLVERVARDLLPPDLGTPIGGTVAAALGEPFTRRVELPADDPTIAKIAGLDREARARGSLLVSSWEIHRRYSHAELEAATLLQLRVHAVFEPAGEECGTRYDEKAACPVCGGGRRQVGPLHVRPRRLPKKDIARTIADEIVVAPRLVHLLATNEFIGLSLGAVLGCHSDAPTEWRQLRATGAPVQVSSLTRFGNSPFDLDVEGRSRCPVGHTLGLNILSELVIQRESWDGADLVATSELVGNRQGLLVPRRMLLISQRLYRALRGARATGFRVETAHLV